MSITKDRMTVVKVQRPLNDPNHPALVYAEGKHRQQQMALPASTDRQLGIDKKGYFRATWTDEGWMIFERVADQSW